MDIVKSLQKTNEYLQTQIESNQDLLKYETKSSVVVWRLHNIQDWQEEIESNNGIIDKLIKTK